MTTNKTNRTIKFALAIVIAICLSILCQIPMSYARVFAAEVASSSVSITNSDFNASTTTVLQSTPNGWSKQGSSTGKAGIIDISESTFSNSSRVSSYALSSTDKPSTAYTDFDTHILMINAKSAVDKNESNHMGYKSNNITLEAYSFYKISVFTLTQENAVASIYLSGLEENIENTSFERYSTALWTEYRFYIATGIDSETVNLELWLGSKTKDSMNAVFFDHITMNKISGSYYYDEAGQLLEKLNNPSTPAQEQELLQTQLKRKNIIDLREFEEDVIENADFETGNKDGWSVIDYLPSNSAASIVSVNNRESFESIGFNNVGSDLSENNNFALALYTTSNKKVAVGYQSEAFKVKPYEAYKITVWAKTSNLNGNAYIKLQEQDDVKDFYNSDTFYTPTLNSVKITTNQTNKLTNNYTAYRFYVKGHELFETSFRLQLWLGEEKNESTGCVVFDNIKFEKVSWEQFKKAETSNTTKVELTSVQTKYSVKNGAFNFASDIEKEVTYPVKPSNWTNKTEDNSKTIFGIVNTYSPIYEQNKIHFGGIRNPKNPSSAGSVDTDANNVLMLYNSQETYQTVTSEMISVSKQTYQRISFDYKTVLQSTNNKLMYVYVLDDDNNFLYVDEGLYSEDWSNYSILIKSSEYSNSIKLVVGLGNETNKVTGYLYLDNVKFESDDNMTDELYNEYSQVNKTLEFTLTNFNHISTTQKHNMYTPYRYEQTLESGEEDMAYGGIIDGSHNENEANNIYGIVSSKQNEQGPIYMPAFIVNNAAAYSLTCKEALTLESNNYYKFSIDVYTRFWGDTIQEDIPEDEKLKYGATVTLKGIEKNLTEIVSNDKWTTYTIYVEVDSSTDVNLKFGIMNESVDIQGQAFFDNITFEKIEENDYNKAVALAETDKTILAITKEDIKDSEDSEPDEEETDNSAFWFLLPSLILFVALVIALAAYFMKKVTIKKWERKKASEFDRNATLHRDVIRKESEEIRDKKVKELEAQITTLKAEITRIEELHQENIRAQRKSTGNITRSAEKDFKNYAKRHTSLENQIEVLNQKIESLNSAEYLLAVQRNLMMEKIKKEKQEKWLQKKEQKEEKKANKSKK